jgi:hypothetical protein
MPKGPPPVRKQPVLDDWVLESIKRAGGQHDEASGHFGEMWIRDCDTREEAREYVRALHRAARRLTRSGKAAVGIHANLLKSGAGYAVQFWACDKETARRIVKEKYGPDETQWPYFRRRAS